MIHFIYIYLIINTFILGLSFDDLPTKYRYSTYLRYIIVTPIVILLYLFFGIFVETLLYLSEMKFFFYVRKTHIQINQTCFVWGSGILNRHGNFIPLSELKVDFRYVVKTYKFISTVKSVYSQHDRQRKSIGDGGGFENVSPELMLN